MSLSEGELFVLAYLPFGLLVSAIAISCRARFGKSLLRKRKYLRLLKERLDSYALLQNKCPIQECDDVVIRFLPYSNSRPFLNSASHGILLGVFKKIEAKNAVIHAVSILLLGSALSLATNVVPLDTILVKFYLFIVGFLVGLLLGGMDGAGHLGQPHYVAFVERTFTRTTRRTPKCRPKDLQHKLLRDLVMKEYAFQARVWATAFALVLILVFVVLFFASKLELPAAAEDSEHIQQDKGLLA